MHILQLLLFHLTGSAHHQILGVFVHGEGNDLPDGVFSCQEHDHAVHTWGNAGVGRRAIGEGVVHGGEFGLYILLAQADQGKGLDHDLRHMVLPSGSGIQVPGLLRGGELANPMGIAPRVYDNQELRRVRYSELDCNGHLSNTKYLNWMEDLLPTQWHRDHALSKVHICYLNEARADQEIALSWVLEDEALALEGRRDTGETTNRVFALQALYRQTRAGASV